jgi:hypothetical protein
MYTAIWPVEALRTSPKTMHENKVQYSGHEIAIIETVRAPIKAVIVLIEMVKVPREVVGEPIKAVRV